MSRVYKLFTISEGLYKQLKKPLNSLHFRGLKFACDIKWVKPVRKPVYHPCNTGDLGEPKFPTKDSPRLYFEGSKELQDANDIVKRIFSLEYLSSHYKLQVYRKQLVDKVKQHKYDNSSLEVKIAKLTANINFYQSILEKKPINRKVVVKAKEGAEKRKKFLKILQFNDYRKFEWLLEQLNLEYKPLVSGVRTVTRKNSLVLLARLRIEKQKEEKLANLRKILDEQKIPFLEKKVEKLKWIKEMEEQLNMGPTVSEDDINECIQKLEKVKIENVEKEEAGYLRKIHPYTMEPYHEKLLKKMEGTMN